MQCVRLCVEGKSFSELKECPLCKQLVEKFELVSSDFAKAIAMGADAVAVASAAMVAAASQRVANYLKCSAEELRTFARITGHEDIHSLSVEDLCTVSREISGNTNIPHA